MPRALGRIVDGLGVPRRWRIAVQSDPSKSHFANARGARTTQFRTSHMPVRTPSGMQSALQILIECRSQDEADRVASLILAGAYLGYPDVNRYTRNVSTYEVATFPAQHLQTPPFLQYFNWNDNIEYGIRAAICAFEDDGVLYALEKYRYSLDLDSLTPHSGHPSHGALFAHRYDEPRSQVNAALAILLAYSVIEELQLEIRSSSKNPRFTDNNKGTWNPVVLQDLSARLQAAGIGWQDSFTWMKRGPRTQVDRELLPRLGVPSKWTSYRDVRDEETSIAGAIHYASWIRNFVVAHKFTALAAGIGAYHVHSVQMIARRLLLGRLGLWQVLPGNIPW